MSARPASGSTVEPTRPPTTGDPHPTGGAGPAGSTGGSARAYRRRQRRQQRMAPTALVGVGRPIKAALNRVPFVVALIVILGVGIGAVLWLNTMAGEAGIQTVQAHQQSADMRLQIESLNRDIADLDATPRIAQQARAMGLVPAGDAAILVIDSSGALTVVGTPSPVRAAGGQR